MSAVPAAPGASLVVGAMAAGIHMSTGPLSDSMIFDRASIADGELWRLLTGHLVHSDLSHLLLNVVGMVLIGAAFERRALDWALVVIVSAFGVDLWLWFLTPEVGQYCGMSGVLYGALGFGLIRAWQEANRRWLVAGVATVAVTKVIIEHSMGGAIVAHTAWPVLPAAHAAGTVAGVVSAIVVPRREAS
jgi:rhomboid family GlyGly-CTERM serine protease